MPSQQYRYFLLTIPQHLFVPYLPPGYAYVKGQVEEGGNTGYVHWQLLAISEKKITISRVKDTFGRECHVEPSRSQAANEYVWKEDTRIAGTQFELGQQPISRARPEDWDRIRECAKKGRFDEIPGDIYIRSYNNLKKIAKDHSRAPFRPTIECKVFWGVTGSGKSHRAFEESGMAENPEEVYVKPPTSKWWDGYRGEDKVIIDEFRGDIGISHLLRWLDKYPCYVEEKGGQLPLKATKFWICSNLCPHDWYKHEDCATIRALERRLNVTYFDTSYSE